MLIRRLSKQALKVASREAGSARCEALENLLPRLVGSFFCLKPLLKERFSNGKKSQTPLIRVCLASVGLSGNPSNRLNDRDEAKADHLEILRWISAQVSEIVRSRVS